MLKKQPKSVKIYIFKVYHCVIHLLVRLGYINRLLLITLTLFIAHVIIVNNSIIVPVTKVCYSLWLILNHQLCWFIRLQFVLQVCSETLWSKRLMTSLFSWCKSCSNEWETVSIELIKMEMGLRHFDSCFWSVQLWAGWLPLLHLIWLSSYQFAVINTSFRWKG